MPLKDALLQGDLLDFWGVREVGDRRSRAVSSQDKFSIFRPLGDIVATILEVHFQPRTISRSCSFAEFHRGLVHMINSAYVWACV